MGEAGEEGGAGGDGAAVDDASHSAGGVADGEVADVVGDFEFGFAVGLVDAGGENVAGGVFDGSVVGDIYYEVAGVDKCEACGSR